MKLRAVHRSQAFTLQLKKISASIPSDVGCAISHYLKWGTLPPNYVGNITQYVREAEGREQWNERKYRKIITELIKGTGYHDRSG